MEDFMRKLSKSRLVRVGKVSSETRAALDGIKVEFDSSFLRYD
jgi:hypothetical protein